MNQLQSSGMAPRQAHNLEAPVRVRSLHPSSVLPGGPGDSGLTEEPPLKNERSELAAQTGTPHSSDRTSRSRRMNRKTVFLGTTNQDAYLSILEWDGVPRLNCFLKWDGVPRLDTFLTSVGLEEARSARLSFRLQKYLALPVWVRRFLSNLCGWLRCRLLTGRAARGGQAQPQESQKPWSEKR